MLTYNYKAKTTQGSITAGSLTAGHREAAIAILKRKGYYLLSVEPQSQLSAIFTRGTHTGINVGIKEKAIFTRQLATLLKAGMKLTTALKTLSRQTKNKYLSTVIEQLHNDIEQSSSLSEAMSKHPKVFSKVYTAIVEAAEQSGALAGTLSVLSSQLKLQASVNAQIRSALIYPVFLLVVSACVVGVLMTFVIPKFIDLFISAEQTLPTPTRILIVLTNLLKNSWWVIFILLLGLICSIMTGLKNKRFKLFFDSMLLKLPLVGALNRKLQLARFARTLGSLLNGGVRILSAVGTTRGITNNSAFAKEIARIEESVLKGTTLAEAIAKQTYFSEVIANMVAVGENSGMLPEMLLEMADMYDQESESAISSMTTLLGPLMIVILGLIIGFVVFAILMPIFETSTIVS